MSEPSEVVLTHPGTGASFTVPVPPGATVESVAAGWAHSGWIPADPADSPTAAVPVPAVVAPDEPPDITPPTVINPLGE